MHDPTRTEIDQGIHNVAVPRAINGDKTYGEARTELIGHIKQSSAQPAISRDEGQE